MSTKSIQAFLGKLAANLAAAVGVMVLFDLGAYLLISKEGIPTLPSYKNLGNKLNLKEALRIYPRHYHIADSQMGFDIAPNQPRTDFVIPDKKLAIFSNALGCMDHHTTSEIRQAPSYEYITGDSFTWGYADYDAKYPTVYEAQTGRMVVKCGLTHSGQAHQFDKFQKVVKIIGHYPKRVIIGYFENDVVNDYAYPHTTIIEGFQVDTAQVNSRYQLVQRNLSQVRKTILQSIDGIYVSPFEQLTAWIKTHSLSINLMEFGINTLLAGANELDLVSGTRLGNRNEDLSYSIYWLADNVGFDQNYLTLDITEPNRRAIDRWIKDARAHSYELLFVLIPTKGGFAQAPSYIGVQQFLQAQQVPFIDLAKVFSHTERAGEFFYWQHDGHLNNEGNTFVGNYLAKQYGN